MSIARYSADQARAKARVRRRRVDATTEPEIARHAARDDTATDAVDFDAALAHGHLRVVTPLDVAAIRAKTGLSQERFARAFQISPHTVRNWEQGRRQPEGPALALLRIAARHPKMVRENLASAA